MSYRNELSRRQLLIGGAAVPLSAAAWHALAGDATYIADMHFHSFFFRPDSAQARPLAPFMAAGNATLVAWSMVGDVPWIRPSARGLKQTGTPQRGATVSWFDEELGRVKKHLDGQGLKTVLATGDVDLAVKGVPHVVLSVEGASFLDEGLDQVQAAYDKGVRHIQLVHYIKNTIGDFQTERPQYNGLTSFGKDVVRECNRLGILIDLAHCTSEAVNQALEISKAPMVWSHSSVTKSGKPLWSMPTARARQLTLSDAKSIAAKGGVVGLWSMSSDVGRNFLGYADRIWELADWLGSDHVAFGTDMNAIAKPAIVSYADLQRVVRHWQRLNVDQERVGKIAMGNYARVLKTAFAARTA